MGKKQCLRFDSMTLNTTHVRDSDGYNGWMTLKLRRVLVTGTCICVSSFMVLQ